MEWAALLRPDGLPSLLAVLGMLLLAAALLRFNFHHAVNRAFALFLVLRGLSYALGVGREVLLDAGDLEGALLLARLYPYFVLPIPLVLLAFLARYPHRRAPVGGRGVVLLAALAAAGLELAYLADHGLVNPVPITAGPGLLFISFDGVLAPLLGVVNLAFSVASLVLARDYVRAAPGRRRQSLGLVWLGFTLNALFELVGAFVFLDRILAAGDIPLLLWLQVPGVFLLAAGVALRARHAARDADARAALRRHAPLLAVAGVTGLSVPYDPLYFTFLGVWRLSLPALVTYALLRYQLFDIDVRVKWTIRQSTVAAAFIGMFFVVSELAAAVFSETLGSMLGIVAAGVLVFAIAPIQHLAERVAHVAMPQARPMAALDQQERASIYLEQVRAAWQDGNLTRTERRVLEVARERLGIPADEAARLERQVVG